MIQVRHMMKVSMNQWLAPTFGACLAMAVGQSVRAEHHGAEEQEQEQGHGHDAAKDKGKGEAHAAHHGQKDHHEGAHGAEHHTAGHHEAYVNPRVIETYFKPFTKSVEVTGPTKKKKVVLTAAELNRGQKLYVQHCFACHGVQGDGRGPASAYLRPAPRDFRAGIFKFGLVTNEKLPHDRDMVELIQRGLNGTAMHPWDLTDQAALDIWNYIKTFSPRWQKEKKLGERVVPTPDPWKGQASAAIERGKAVYHINAQCRTCHPAYVTQKEFYELAKENDSLWAYGDLEYRAKLRPANKAWAPLKILPPDFLYANIRNIADTDDKETRRRRLFRVIGAGVGGAGMPTWKGAITDKDLWALSYYVNHLYEKRQGPEGYALRDALDHQEAFTPPAEDASESDG